jgi:hypothetical protein
MRSTPEKLALSRGVDAGEVGPAFFAFCLAKKAGHAIPPKMTCAGIASLEPSSPCTISFLTLHPMQCRNERIDIFGRVVEGE